MTTENQFPPPLEPPKPPEPAEPFPGFGELVKTTARDIRTATKAMQEAEQKLVSHEHMKWAYRFGTRPLHAVGSPEWRAWVAAGRPRPFFGAEEIPAREKWQQIQEELLLARRDAVRDLARVTWFNDFYAAVPSLVEIGAVTSLDDYLELMKSDPTDIVSQEDLDVARDVLSQLTGARKVTTREDAPDWLHLTSEEEAATREFLKAEVQLLPPVALHSLTIKALLESLAARPAVKLPEGMSDRELLAIASVMDIPESELRRVVDITELIQPYSDAVSEREELIKAVLSGEQEWEMPELGFWGKVMFTVLSPMQVAADVIKPYLENVSYPWAGFVAYSVARFLSGTQAIEDNYAKMRAMGYSPWEGMSEAYQEWPLPWYLKLPLEIITDPITYIPGLFLSVPAKILTKIPTTATRVLGTKLIYLNRGLWSILDIPFDAGKALWAHIPKTFNQATRFELDAFRDLLIAASSKQSGKVVNMLTPDDLIKTLERSTKEFAATPMAQGNVFVELGSELVKHAPLGVDDIRIWSRSLGGKLDDITPAIVESVDDIISDSIMKMGSPAENAKRLAIALAVEDSPAIIGKILKDISVLTTKYVSRVPRAIQIGKTAKISPVAQMTEYLVSGQKTILAAIERSAYAKGKALSGTVLSLMNAVDKLERGVFRVTLDRWLVRPVAEAYLGSVAYPIWNVFEGIFVSVMEGVVPRMVKQDAFQRMFLGIRGIDSRVAAWSASDVAGMLGTMPGREGSISILPGKVPEKILGLKPPKWIAGKDWFEWTGRKWIELSDIWGTALRANFLMRKMASYLAEYSFNVAGHDINAAFRKLIGAPPTISKKSIGLTSHELKQEMFARLTTGLKSEVVGMKEILTNSSLMQGEALKILRQATELSPQAKTLGEQMIARGEVLRTTDDIMNFCKTIADQSVADLRAFPTQAPEAFRFMADQMERQTIGTPDDLMQIFQHYEVMADSASRVPMRLLSQVFEEADELKRLGKFRQLEELWRTSRASVDDITSSINESLSRARAVVQGKSGLLKDKEQIALSALLERNTARITLQEQFLRFDGRLLDDFWALPRAMRSAEEHAALRAYRWENILKYKSEDAVLGAGDFLERKSYAKLYYDIPTPKMFHVDASSRALSPDDCAKAMNCNVDALTTGLLESMTFQDKAYFIQMIKQSADAHPTYFKGFTEDKIGQVYDSIVRGLKMSPGVDITTQKILQQVEGVKQRMIALRMTHSLSPTEEKALLTWIDDVARGMDDIFGEPMIAISAVTREKLKPLVSLAQEKNMWITGSHATGKATAKSDIDIIVQVSDDVFREPLGFAMKNIEDRILKLSPEADVFFSTASKKEMLSIPAFTKGGIVEDPAKVWKNAKPIKNFFEKPGLVAKESWDDIRQKASERAHKEYYKAFADYTNENIIDAMGKMIYPFWTYHLYRWFFLPRTFLRKPGAMAAWGKYYEYSDRGYQHIPGTDLEFNPAVGSAFGATFSLTRHDFKSYYENLGFLGEMVDYTQKRGFFPGIHVTLPIALTSTFSGRPPEFGEILPPLHTVGLNLLVASNVPGVADAAKWLKDKIFHANFHDYYTATVVSGKQVEAGGKLVEGQSGVDLWFKLQRGEKLTEEEQALWDEAYEEAAWIGILRSEFPEFRLRTEDMLEAYEQVTSLIEAQTGLDRDLQDNLWKHNLRPTDVLGGMPLDLQAALDQMWQWRIYFGRGAILMPPEYSDLYNLMDKYYDKVEGLQMERLGLQMDTNKGFLTPTPELHYSGREWRSEYASHWSDYIQGTETLEADPEFADAIDAMTTEGHARLMRELGFAVPPVDPMREVIRLYFNIEMEKKVDPYTGEEDWDYLRFWLEREAVRMALTEEQRAEFDAYVRRYKTPMEILFRNVSNTYLRGYRAVTRIVLEEFTDEEKALIAEYYADTTTRERKLEIKEVVSHGGRKLISHWDSARTDARAALRTASPKLDFWLYVFGYITAPKTNEAKAMIDAWEKDKSSIVLGITESPLLETVATKVEEKKAKEVE